MTIETIDDARASIKRAVADDGEYSHNIVSSALRTIDSKFGREAANGLIDEFDLTTTYNINKVATPATGADR